MAITNEKILDIMIQQFKVWLELEDSWKPPENVDVALFNATKARDAMQHVHGNTEFAKIGLEWADRKAS